MNTLEFAQLNLKYEYPSCWNELSLKQLKRIIRLYARKLNENDFLLLAFFALLPTRRFIAVNHNIYFRFGILRYFPLFLYRAIRRNSKLLLPVAIDGFVFAKETMQFLTKEVDMTKQKLPFIQVKHKKYYGPADNFENLAFGEYILAEPFFEDFAKNNNMDALTSLMALLYREKKQDSKPQSDDVRMEYESKSFQKRLNLFKSIPFYKKYIVYLYYAGNRNNLFKQFPELTNGSSDDEGKSSDWQSVIFELNNNSVTDESIQKILSAKLWNVFAMFKHNKKKHEEYLKQMEKIKNRNL